jgi:NADPH-dependent 2,4-dienoyl-CoA reductase/sulfur reductase-like enzyme
MDRRDFFKLPIIFTPLLAKNSTTITNNNIKSFDVVIIGGGFAGLSTAKYIKNNDKNLSVLLIEKDTLFFSYPMSNLFLVDEFKFEKLCNDYNSSAINNNFKFLNETVIDLNKEKKIVITANINIKYKYLVMALGIDYNYKKLFKNDTNKISKARLLAPAGLIGVNEVLRLRKMVHNVDNGNFVIVLPHSSFKCPSAPYERACLIAQYYQTHNINAKVIIIDPRNKPAAQSKLYLDAFNNKYKNTIIYKNKTRFKDVNFSNKTIEIKKYNTKLKKYETNILKYAQASIIPPNMANKLYKKVGIDTYAQGWVKLKFPSFRTQSDDSIYVLGDAQGEYTYVKNAQIASSSAYNVAMDITNRFHNKAIDYTLLQPSGICFSILSKDKATFINHSFILSDNIYATYEKSNLSTQNLTAAKNWHKGLVSELFD